MRLESLATAGRLRALGVAGMALTLAACSTGGDAKTTAPVESQRVSASASLAPREAAPAAVVPAGVAVPPVQAALASQEYNQDPGLRCDVLEVKRLSGGAMLVKWRLSRRTQGTQAGLTAAPAATIHHTWSWDYVYVTDPAENKKYFGLRDSAGAWLAQGDAKYYAPGDRQVMWMKFPAPPESSARIAFVFQGFPPFEDLTVSR